ncbi:hypothetical protein K7432_001068 [Basidiobolus ranarum]|uniref:Uncharacterized protein n=1 Tax=Basidiobolus ranarum TaxID=34480 RepID=A0ABR2WA79_9FUNG
MSSSNKFTQSISRSFRKLLTKKFPKFTTKNQQETSPNDECSDSGVSLTNSDTSTWERVSLGTPELENVRVTHILRNTEDTPSHHTWSNQTSSWLKRPVLNTNKSELKEFQIDASVFDKLCSDFNELTPVENPPSSNDKHCESCFITPKSPKKRCPCEYERAQNTYLEDSKPKKSIFITGSLLKRNQMNQVHTSKKFRNQNRASGLIGPLFGRKKFLTTKGGSNQIYTEKTSSRENVSEFESRLQKVESFERMIVDPEYRNETIRLELTPNILS